MAIGAGCSSRAHRDADAFVGDLPIHAEVVAGVAARDGVTLAQARTQVADVLRWVQRRHERLGDDAGLAPERATHLRRSALARLYLQEVFEPNHRASDIPAGDPLLARALVDPRHVHPTIHEVCQVVVGPPGKFDPETTPKTTEDPRWRAQASDRLAHLAEFAEEVVPPGDPDACTLLARLRPFAPKDDDQIVVRVESAGGFDLDACAELAQDGSCEQPRFAPEWTSVVRDGPVPGFRPPFFSRFGLHFVLVHAVLPAKSPDALGFTEEVRASVTPRWRAEAYAKLIEDLRTRAAVQILGAKRDP